MGGVAINGMWEGCVLIGVWKDPIMYATIGFRPEVGRGGAHRGVHVLSDCEEFIADVWKETLGMPQFEVFVRAGIEAHSALKLSERCFGELFAGLNKDVAGNAMRVADRRRRPIDGDGFGAIDWRKEL